MLSLDDLGGHRNYHPRESRGDDMGSGRGATMATKRHRPSDRLNSAERRQVNEMIDRILELAWRRGIRSAGDLAAKCGLAANRFTNWRKAGEPSARQLQRMAKVLSTSIEYLLSGETSSFADFPDADRYAFALQALQRLEPEEAARRLLCERPRDHDDTSDEVIHGRQVHDDTHRRRKGVG